MRLALVSEHANPLAAIGQIDAGGQNVHVAALAAALVRRGHDVDVYTRRDDARAPERVLCADGYTVVHVDAGPPAPLPKDALLEYMPAFSDRLLDWWTERPPHVAHAHFWMSGLASVAAARLVGRPALLTFHALGTVKKRYQGEMDTSPSARLRLERMLCRTVDHVVATSTDEIAELRRMGMPPNGATVVPCGVDLELFRPHGPVAERDATHRLLSIGRLVPRKGVDDVIRALALLPDTELLVAGGPPRSRLICDEEACRLREVAIEHGVQDRVRFLGSVPRSDLPAVIRSADAVVATPWYEPFGMAAVEAMACGRPVIASNVGGLLDTVVDGVTGLLVPPRQPATLARALRRLLADPVAGQAMGLAGADRAALRYGWDKVALDTERVYEQTLRSRAESAMAG